MHQLSNYEAEIGTRLLAMLLGKKINTLQQLAAYTENQVANWKGFDTIMVGRLKAFLCQHHLHFAEQKK